MINFLGNPLYITHFSGVAVALGAVQVVAIALRFSSSTETRIAASEGGRLENQRIGNA